MSLPQVGYGVMPVGSLSSTIASSAGELEAPLVRRRRCWTAKESGSCRCFPNKLVVLMICIVASMSNNHSSWRGAGGVQGWERKLLLQIFAGVLWIWGCYSTGFSSSSWSLSSAALVALLPLDSSDRKAAERAWASHVERRLKFYLQAKVPSRRQYVFSWTSDALISDMLAMARQRVLQPKWLAPRR
jgi:hypothetical protein